MKTNRQIIQDKAEVLHKEVISLFNLILDATKPGDPPSMGAKLYVFAILDECRNPDWFDSLSRTVGVRECAKRLKRNLSRGSSYYGEKAAELQRRANLLHSLAKEILYMPRYDNGEIKW